MIRYGYGMSGWGYVLMTISMVLFWTLVVAGIVAVVRYLGRTSQQAERPAASRPSPEELLAERFARGEIDEEEYRRRVQTLRAGGHHLTTS